MRVLFVDDDERLAELVRRGLSESGHIVDCANTGEAGLDFATGRRYDAIVLDVMMPKLDGLAVVRRLRELGSSTPILFLTARDTPEDTIAGLNAGADDYLRKPFVFAAALDRAPDRTAGAAAPRHRRPDVQRADASRQARNARDRPHRP